MKSRLLLSLVLCSINFNSLAFIAPAALVRTLPACSVWSGVLSGTIKDPKGAVIAGAQIAVRNEATGESRVTTTDGEGRFKLESLAAGRYVVSISSPGFKAEQSPVVIEDGRTAAIEIKLEVAGVRTELAVPAKGAVAANSDTNYRALRNSGVFESYTISNLTLKRDVGGLNLQSGSIHFLPPVVGRVAMAVFVGKGEFTLTPPPALSATTFA